MKRRLSQLQAQASASRVRLSLPPQYDPNSPLESPPAYALQSSFKIGTQIASTPLVSTSHLKAHLNLLRAFKELRTRVEQHPLDFPASAARLVPEKRWIWFLELALERFQRWVENLECRSLDDFIAREFPPLDVLLLWHAYMLNPIWYAEDCSRLPILEKLTKLKTWDTSLLDILIDIGSMTTYKPPISQTSRWLEVTHLPFDPIASTNVLLDQHIECSTCGSSISASYITGDGEDETGYAQRRFKCVCSYCENEITKEKLAVAKFARDIARPLKNSDGVANLDYEIYLPGSLHTPTNPTDSQRARIIKKQILECPAFASREPEIKKKVGYSMKNVKSSMSKYLTAPLLMKKILSAYNDGRPFSLDLVGAVIRQGSFIDKMYSLDWTQPGYFDTDEDAVVLEHCAARYHAFLDLIASSETGFFVPTLDIDLAWHTHQLSPSRYASDCMTFTKRFINHDDKVEESHLSTSFDMTCRVWEQHFGVPYMHCGCPLPGISIGQRLSKLRHFMFHGDHNVINPPARDDSLLATHPSDHNAVFLNNVSTDSNRQGRIHEIQRRRARDLEEVRAGRMNESLYRRGERHSPAFLVPVPLYYNSTVGGCAAMCAAGGMGSGVSDGGSGNSPGGGGSVSTTSDGSSGGGGEDPEKDFTCMVTGCGGHVCGGG